MTTEKPREPREFWYLQEPTSNRALIRDDSEKWPDDVNGRPSDKWIKFYLSDEIHAAIGMGITRYSAVMEDYRQLLEQCESLERALEFYHRNSTWEHDGLDSGVVAGEALEQFRAFKKKAGGT